MTSARNYNQCDQMLELKVTQFFLIAQKVAKYLGYFYKKIWCKELSKIAQSGHIDYNR